MAKTLPRKAVFSGVVVIFVAPTHWGPRTSSAPCTPGTMAVALPRLNVAWICGWAVGLCGGGGNKRGMSVFGVCGRSWKHNEVCGGNASINHILYILYIYIMIIYTESFPKVYVCDVVSLRIQVCPKEGILPKILLPGEWDWNPQFYSREGSVFLGHGWFGCDVELLQVSIYMQFLCSCCFSRSREKTGSGKRFLFAFHLTIHHWQYIPCACRPGVC